MREERKSRMPRPADRIPRHPTNINTYTIPVPRLPFDFMRPTKHWAWPPTTHHVLITKSTHRGMLPRPGGFAICKQIRCFPAISNTIPAFSLAHVVRRPWPLLGVVLPEGPPDSDATAALTFFAGKLSLSSSCQQTRPSLYGNYMSTPQSVNFLD